MRTYIYPYAQGSESASLLAKEMGIKRLLREGSKVKDAKDLFIINWGSASVPYQLARILNNASAVAIGHNKLRTFNALDEKVSIPEYTTDRNTALEWVKSGNTVAVRATVTGNSGQGLTMADKESDVGQAPLYVKYIPKKEEYRVHIIDGSVVKVQKKVFPKDKEKPTEGINWQIRNHEHGFIFAIADPRDIASQSILDESKKAVAALGLDFAGVDILWNEKQAKPYVLEVNTAPGLENSTIRIYAKTFETLIDA